MVSLLWPTNSAAAERLEELGNEVIEEYSTPILCAYSLNGPSSEPVARVAHEGTFHTIAC